MDEPARLAALIAELDALLVASHAERDALRELLMVVVGRLESIHATG